MLFRSALSILPIISRNISYSYISKKMGYKPIIAFDLIFGLYPYLISIVPNPSEYVVAIIQLVAPVIFAFNMLKFVTKKEDKFIDRYGAGHGDGGLAVEPLHQGQQGVVVLHHQLGGAVKVAHDDEGQRAAHLADVLHPADETDALADVAHAQLIAVVGTVLKHG